MIHTFNIKKLIWSGSHAKCNIQNYLCCKENIGHKFGDFGLGKDVLGQKRLTKRENIDQN